MSPRRSFSDVGSTGFAVAIIAACAIAGSWPGWAAAQERFAGRWVVARAVAGPWASDPKNAIDEADARRLLGKRLAIGANVFRAPEPLGCAEPSYVFRDATPDTLFEGSLNSDGADRPTDPVAIARTLGVNRKTMRAMTASCSEVEFVLIDPDTILFALNNRVFTVRRSR